MTDPGSVESAILLLDAELEEATDTYAGAAMTAAEAEARYRVEKAKALLQVEGRNADEREANALSWQTPDGTVAELLWAKTTSEAVAQGALERMRSVRARLSAQQSLLRNYQEAS